MRGVSRSSRTLGRRSGGRDDVAGRAATSRTTKPCGPGLPTLRPSRAKPRLRAAMGARKPGPQGERVISRKAIAQGRPDCSVLTCGSFPVLFIMHGGRGCGGHPAFPAPSAFRRDRCLARLGRISAARMMKLIPAHAQHAQPRCHASSTPICSKVTRRQNERGRPGRMPRRPWIASRGSRRRSIH
jgi:hypothetical protein